MLVFKKGEIVREVVPISEGNFQLKIYHPKSKVSITSKVSTKNNINNSPYYKIQREGKDGKFDFFEEIIGSPNETI